MPTRPYADFGRDDSPREDVRLALRSEIHRANRAHTRGISRRPCDADHDDRPFRWNSTQPWTKPPHLFGLLAFLRWSIGVLGQQTSPCNDQFHLQLSPLL